MDDRLNLRITLEHPARRGGGDLVIYWMRSALRVAENPALEAAAWYAHESRMPLLVYQSVAAAEWFASDRMHAFVLEGTAALTQALAQRGIRHVLHFLPRRSDDLLSGLAPLAQRSAAVFTEDFPLTPAVSLRGELARRSGCAVYTCLLYTSPSPRDS